MTIPHFDYDYWRGQTRTDWEEQLLHWHCYAAKLDPGTYADDAARRDLSTTLPPRVLKDWLQKPASAIKRLVATPDDAMTWLRQQCDAYGFVPMGGESAEGRALYDLQCGNDVCWVGWLGYSAVVHLSIIATAGACHEIAFEKRS